MSVFLFNPIRNEKEGSDEIANSVFPDQTAPESDLGLHYLLSPNC